MKTKQTKNGLYRNKQRRTFYHQAAQWNNIGDPLIFLIGIWNISKMMTQRPSMSPLDVVVLLKIIGMSGQTWTQKFRG
tara:strand:- start:511 stop:744 length:234 start_codon:yes stop_codon:yes gene_type:complete